jgi:carboxypeptidase PM20D1
VERLLEEGIEPERTVYMVFNDEQEVSSNGARMLAESLKSRGVKAEMVLDHGGSITSGIVPMISEPVALVGTSEKVFLPVELTCKCAGGHPSMPQQETAISILSKALVKITENQPAPVFTPPVKSFLSYIGPETPWPARIVFANQWLLGGVIKSIYTSSSEGNATVRTTTAPTMLKAGIRDDLMPTQASAIIQFGLLPGDTSEKVMARLKKVINDDRISVTAFGNPKEPAKVSPVDCGAFSLLNKTIKESFENTYVAPILMTASFDGYYYSEVSPNIYRFTPYRSTSEDLARMHGDNERITIENYKELINFYYRLVKNFQEDFN